MSPSDPLVPLTPILSLRIEVRDRATGFVRWVLVGEGTRIELTEGSQGNLFLLQVEDALDIRTVLRLLVAWCQPLPSDLPVVFASGRSIFSQPANALLALFLASNWSSVRLNPSLQRGHVVLAHAMPLACSVELREYVTDHFCEIVKGEQLLLLAASDLVLVKVGKSYLSEIVKRNLRLIQMNSDWRVVYTTDICGVINMWKEFCQVRFGSSLATEHLDLLRLIFGFPGFGVKEFWMNDECVVRSLFYIENRYKIFFDVLAPWDLKVQRCRPGIYAAIHNLCEACRIDGCYSLCYGVAAYKDRIVRGLPRLSI